MQVVAWFLVGVATLMLVLVFLRTMWHEQLVFRGRDTWDCPVASEVDARVDAAALKRIETTADAAADTTADTTADAMFRNGMGDSTPVSTLGVLRLSFASGLHGSPLPSRRGSVGAAAAEPSEPAPEPPV